MANSLYKDFDEFSRALIASKDVDPVYLIIPEIIDHYKFDPSWFVMVYVSFYNLGAAIHVCKEMPTVEQYNRFKFLELHKLHAHYGIERRGHIRKAQNHEEVMQEITFWLWNSLPKLLKDKVSNEVFRKSVETIPHHGVWASFKIAEVFEKGLGYKHLALPDLGLEGRDLNSNDGPIGGLRWIFGKEERYDKSWYEHWNNFGQKLAQKWGVDIGEVETCLCKFHKLKTGKYYIGHDIHEFHELIPVMGEKIWKDIMFNVFDERILQDKSKNIMPLQRSWKSSYGKTGELINSAYASELPEADVLETIMEL